MNKGRRRAQREKEGIGGRAAGPKSSPIHKWTHTQHFSINSICFKIIIVRLHAYSKIIHEMQTFLCNVQECER